MKKYILCTIIVLFAVCQTQAQIFDPVDWEFESKALEDGSYELTFTAALDAGWYIYSQNIEDGGPIPTSFEFDEHEANGDIVEKGELIEKFDKMFEMQVGKYSEKVSFVANVKAKAGDTITGYLTYMTCDDQRCLPPEDVDFEFTLE